MPVPPAGGGGLLGVPLAELQPTQLCVGMAEIRSRQLDFAKDDPQERRRYLRKKPTPLVRSACGECWMVYRHHRLRGLMELDSAATAFCYVVLQL